MSSPVVLVAFDPQECVLLDLGEVVPRAGVDESFFVSGEKMIQRRRYRRVESAGGGATPFFGHSVTLVAGGREMLGVA